MSFMKTYLHKNLFRLVRKHDSNGDPNQIDI